MAGMTLSADDRMYDLLVRVARAQRRRRDWGHEESAVPLPRAAGDDASGGTEQDPRWGA